MADGLPSFLVEDLRRLGVTLPPGAPAALRRYLDLLLEANRSFNLTAVRDPDDAWRRHVLDSLTLLPFLADVGQGARVVDVGSGGGLPGIPLALARPDLKVTLLEATSKKAAFCRRAVEQVPIAGVRVIDERSETVGRQAEHRERYDVAVCRAIGPMRELLEYTLPLVRVGGLLLAMKGPSVEAELAAAEHAMDVLGAADLRVFDAYPPGFDRHTVIVVLARHAPMPRRFPRPPGTPRRDPL